MSFAFGPILTARYNFKIKGNEKHEEGEQKLY
jgi:hypothetical protein